MPKPVATRVEDLLGHAEWLRKLALGLAGDQAEDLVQDTWLAALRTPPEPDVGQRGWLTVVARNFSRRSWRHQQARERLQAQLAGLTEWAPSPETVLERARAQRELAELVLALDEPYRTTVLLRYHDGRSSAEVARLQGVPPGTVRRRLKMGLDRLRAQLNARGDGPSARRAVLPASAVAGRLWPGVIAMLVMSKKKVVGVMIVLALLSAGGAALLRARKGGEVHRGVAEPTASTAPTVAKHAHRPPAPPPSAHVSLTSCLDAVAEQRKQLSALEPEFVRRAPAKAVFDGRPREPGGASRPRRTRRTRPASFRRSVCAVRARMPNLGLPRVAALARWPSRRLEALLGHGARTEAAHARGQLRRPHALPRSDGPNAARGASHVHSSGRGGRAARGGDHRAVAGRTSTPR